MAKVNLIKSLFTPIGEQITPIRELNSERDWGFTEEDFAATEQSASEWPDNRLAVITLVPYLPGKNGMGGVERTFQELWKAAISVQQDSGLSSAYDKTDSDHLSLLKGIKHPAKNKPVLRLEVIDLGYNRARAAVKVRSQKTSPHAGIIASAWLHPEWVKAMDSDTVPSVCISGYQVYSGNEYPTWRNVPELKFSLHTHRIWLGTRWCDTYNLHQAVPKFVHPPIQIAA